MVIPCRTKPRPENADRRHSFNVQLRHPEGDPNPRVWLLFHGLLIECSNSCESYKQGLIHSSHDLWCPWRIQLICHLPWIHVIIPQDIILWGECPSNTNAAHQKCSSICMAACHHQGTFSVWFLLHGATNPFKCHCRCQRPSVSPSSIVDIFECLSMTSGWLLIIPACTHFHGLAMNIINYVVEQWWMAGPLKCAELLLQIHFHCTRYPVPEDQTSVY